MQKGGYYDLLKISISDHISLRFPDHCATNMLKHTGQGLCGHNPLHPFLQFEQVAAPVESPYEVHKKLFH